jgi:hypothetical protein
MFNIEDYLNFYNFQKFIQIILSLYIFVYSLLVLRDIIDSQSHYESRFEFIFKVSGILLVVASFFLLVSSIS